MLKKTIVITSLASVFALSSHAEELDFANKKRAYVGFETGYSVPLAKEVTDKPTKAKIRLKKSSMFTGRVGYEFYPHMALELTGTYQPSFGMGLAVPDMTPGQFNKGSTKVSGKVVTLNLVYDLPALDFGMMPYVTMGLGMAKLEPKAAEIKNAQGLVVTKIKNKATNCFSYQFGGGLTKQLSDNVKFDLGLKLQMANNVKIKYDGFDLAASNAAGAHVYKPGTFKKTVGVAEITAGFTIALF